MKVKDTWAVDSVYSTLYNKMYNMAPAFNKEDPYHAVTWIKRHYPSWQYNGVEQFDNIMLWCEEHFGDWWVWSHETIYFYKEEDRTLFLLRWS